MPGYYLVSNPALSRLFSKVWSCLFIGMANEMRGFAVGVHTYTIYFMMSVNKHVSMDLLQFLPSSFPFNNVPVLGAFGRACHSTNEFNE